MHDYHGPWVIGRRGQRSAAASRARLLIRSQSPAARFCPTGGITAASASGYLALPNVGCVGGSWLTPADAVAAGDWDRISSLAREAAALR